MAARANHLNDMIRFQQISNEQAKISCGTLQVLERFKYRLRSFSTRMVYVSMPNARANIIYLLSCSDTFIYVDTRSCDKFHC